jgi:cytidylate kinase
MPQPRGPLVAFSRWAGAFGDEVAERVAEWLDYGLFGAEAIDRLAADPALSASLEAGLDAAQRVAIGERVATVLARAPAAPAALVRVVATLGERGMAVVLGRGAASILPPARALRVLVVAPEAQRAERMAQAQGIPREEAVACIASADSARRSALRERFGIAAEDLTHYDLVLNTEALSIEAAAALVVDALRRRFPLH